ncbi:hypothetical protein [Sessilibacter corallicola]|uniref:Uncharacterized protein n=1 Tax=Sessilibacter corallicola TaxID=2904075 RepID=A0ABQ0A821_9GAMM|nr:hypothetical protein [Sessilibacter corallicola]MCE2028940.1 hypothetical protein [Sessilibacter corallicola]
MYSIKSYGFEPHEIDVIKKQVRLIATRTQHGWQYTGEGIDGDVVLAKQHTDLHPGSKLVLVGEHPDSSSELVLEYPIRIMKFMELLQQCEPSAKHSSATAVAELMKDKSAHETVLLCNQKLVRFKSDNGKVYLENGDEHDLIDAILKTPPSAITEKNEIPIKEKLVWSSCISLKKLLWNLARKEIGFARLHWSLDKGYKLISWPQISEWEPNPQIFKLATLYSKQSISIREAAKICRLDNEQVMTFLHACNVCGVSVKASDISSSTLGSVTELQNKQTLVWLRKKIQSYFGLSHGH